MNTEKFTSILAFALQYDNTGKCYNRIIFCCKDAQHKNQCCVEFEKLALVPVPRQSWSAQKFCRFPSWLAKNRHSEYEKDAVFIVTNGEESMHSVAIVEFCLWTLEDCTTLRFCNDLISALSQTLFVYMRSSNTDRVLPMPMYYKIACSTCTPPDVCNECAVCALCIPRQLVRHSFLTGVCISCVEHVRCTFPSECLSVTFV